MVVASRRSLWQRGHVKHFATGSLFTLPIICGGSDSTAASSELAMAEGEGDGEFSSETLPPCMRAPAGFRGRINGGDTKQRLDL